MRYLLDTCAFIDLLFSPERLSPTAKRIMTGESELFVSIASFWEIIIKQQIGKLGIQNTTAHELEQVCREQQIGIIQVPHLDLLRSLPRFPKHGDPFDRLIICQAISDRLPILTSDSQFVQYGVEIVW